MVQKKALKESANVTVAALVGAIASVFFAKWINNYPIYVSSIYIFLYTMLIFYILYRFFKK